MMITRLAALIVLLGIAGYGALVAGRFATGEIERIATERMDVALKAMDLTWARVRMDGLQIAVLGIAPDADSQSLAIEAVVRAAPPFSEIDDQIRLRPPRRPKLPAPKVDMLRNGLDVTLTGLVPDEATKAGLLRAFAEEAPRLLPETLVEIGAASDGPPLAFALAARAVAMIPQAHAVLEPGLLRVTGLVASEEQRTETMAGLVSATTDDVRVALDLRVPPPVISPFSVSLSRAAGGALRLEKCAARSPEEAEAILAMLFRAGLAETPGACAVGLGGPAGDWPEAVAMGIRVLNLLPEGHLRVAHGTVRLTANGPLDANQTAQVESALAAWLPKGYRGRLIQPEEAAPAPETDQVADESGTLPEIQHRPWLTASFDSDGVVLAGRIPGEPMVKALRALASARFPGQILSDALSPLETLAEHEADWQVASFAGVEALALLPEGRLELTDRRLELTGRIEDPVIAGQIHRALSEGVLDLEINTAFSVDLPAQVAGEPMTPERCLLRLNGHVSANPLSFDPGSADLAAASAPTLDTLADLMRRCPNAPFEIGGHTDWQGSEGFNERLSLARANAVRDAFLQRGIRIGRLSVKGYGESRPIASNRTETGRERNRRIAFEVMSATEEARR